MAGTLELRLLGDVEIRREGSLITGFRSRKALALLCYLAATGRPQSRSVLADLLWEDMPEATARRNLTKELTNLRRLLDPWLNITHHTITFNQNAPYWLDIECFEAKVRGSAQEKSFEQLQETVELYRGDFLEGLYIRRGPEFEGWTLAQRTRLRELAMQALYILSLYYSQQGVAEHMVAIDYATRLLSLEPWREGAHRQLILLLALTGQRTAALAQYQTCRQILADEMGVEPSGETVSLYEHILAGDLDRIRLEMRTSFRTSQSLADR